MSRLPRVTLALLLAGLAGGCATPSYVVLLPDDDGQVGKITVQGTQGETRIDQAGHAARLDGSGTFTPKPEQLQADFAATRSARPLLPVQFQLYFESGGLALTPESVALLPQVIEAVARRPAADISIIGHTDTHGPEQDNEALGLTRARWLAEQLAQGGLKAVAISIESHGERNLLVATPDNTPEPRNRRVEIAIR